MFQLRVQFCLIILPLNDNNKNNKQLCYFKTVVDIAAC